jgi:hypothetical protein
MLISDLNILEKVETAHVIGGGDHYEKHEKGYYEEPKKHDWKHEKHDWCKKPGEGPKNGFCPPPFRKDYKPCYKKH